MAELETLIHRAQTAHGISLHDAPLRYRTIAQCAQDRLAMHAEHLFLTYYDEHGSRSSWTYRQFIEQACRTAAYLRKKGLRPGDRFATAAHNHPDTIVQYFAAWLLGCCVIPLNMTEEDQRLHYILQTSGAQMLLCRPDYLDRLPAITKDLSIETIPIDGTYHEQVARCEPISLDEGCASYDSEALLVFTSGTTGNPKGVVLVQQNLLADAEGIAQWHKITSRDRLMCVLPVHHVNGTIVTHVTPFFAGASVVLNRKFQTEYFFPRIRQERVTIVSVVPTLLAFLLEAGADSCDVRQHGFRHIICGAGPLTCDLAARFEERYHIPIIHGYGLSETTCYSCFLEIDLDEQQHRRWMQDYGFPSIGAPIPQNEMAIHDPDGNELGEGQRGEIVIRGWNVMKGYDANPEANYAAFTHGWFRSGDEGFFIRKEDGTPYFFITGRIKELIIRGGVNIAPLEIDEVLARAPGVRAGIAVGFEHDLYGEEVGALVIPAEGATEEAILSYCRQHLPHHKCPKVVLFTDSLPVTSTGKYQRNKVKHLFAQWRSVQFPK
ncbi:MAG: class I adenylate-forming enzyme family protein [Bacteroidota bacterium]|nr:class I adenylate-forming enzyme family protein [Bacteroidota bacterium]MDW8270890.1 class I adenylate-forming enzyme family protein [Bacteroidota bacterium]